MTNDDTQWAVAGLFLEALAKRDFGGLEACLESDVQFRALVPRGPFEISGASEIAGRFRQWFGTKPLFELLDASIGQVGGRVYLRWRFKTDDAEVVEQHAFATGRDRIASIDLLCSGFQTTGG